MSNVEPTPGRAVRWHKPAIIGIAFALLVAVIAGIVFVPLGRDLPGNETSEPDPAFATTPAVTPPAN